MRYENFDLIKSKVEEIKKHEELIRELTSGNIQVRIQYSSSGSIMTIDVESWSRHRYMKQAADLVDQILFYEKTDVSNLKSELEEL